MWIKICGIRDVQTAEAVAKLGADAIGLNFYAKTPRFVDVETASDVVSRLHLRGQIEPIGLFVNHSAEQIATTCRQSGIRTAQIHGDEPPELLAELKTLYPELRVIRAFRFGEEGLQPLNQYMRQCEELAVETWACLIDAHVKGSYGGTGTTVAWNKLQKEYAASNLPPLILAGGLDADNVAEAIETVRPWGIDTASGVEISPGEKDFIKVEQFINNATKAFAKIGPTDGND